MPHIVRGIAIEIIHNVGGHQFEVTVITVKNHIVGRLMTHSMGIVRIIID